MTFPFKHLSFALLLALAPSSPGWAADEPVHVVRMLSPPYKLYDEAGKAIDQVNAIPVPSEGIDARRDSSTRLVKISLPDRTYIVRQDQLELAQKKPMICPPVVTGKTFTNSPDSRLAGKGCP